MSNITTPLNFNTMRMRESNNVGDARTRRIRIIIFALIFVLNYQHGRIVLWNSRTTYDHTLALNNGGSNTTFALPTGPIRVAGIIDSNTDTTCCGHVYPTYLQPYLDAVYPGIFIVREYAVWGCTICNAPHGDKPFTKVDEYGKAKEFHPDSTPPDYIIVMGGANDSKQPNWERRDCKNHFEDDLKSLYESFLSLTPSAKVFASEPPAVSDSSACCNIRNSVIENEIVSKIHAVAASVGGSPGVRVIETYNFTKPHTCSEETNPNCWFKDGVHFREHGAKAVANFFGCHLLQKCHVDGYPACPRNECVCNFDTVCDAGEICGRCPDCPGPCP